MKIQQLLMFASLCVIFGGCAQSQIEPPPKPVPLGSESNARLASEYGPKWDVYLKHLQTIASSLPPSGKVADKPISEKLSPPAVNVWSGYTERPNQGASAEQLNELPNTELMMIGEASDPLRWFEMSSDSNDINSLWGHTSNFYFALKNVKEAADPKAKAYKVQEDILKVGLPKYVVIIRIADKKDASVVSSADFSPGVLSFELFLADVDSERILGTLTDKATSSDKVRAYGKENQMAEKADEALNEDLVKSATSKVVEDVKKLTGGKFDAEVHTYSAEP